MATPASAAPTPEPAPHSGGAGPESGPRPLAAAPQAGSASTQLVTDQGRTILTDTVVSKIAGTATRQVDGVHALGGGTARAVEALRGRIPGARVNHSQGVAVEVGERQTAIDIGIVADYGVPIYDLGAAIRRNVIDAVERMTGLEVVEVNVTVYDVHIPGDDEGLEATASSRVQ
ncbi:Asp23/Gls24 family envelope stress response protein [Tomitella gaofuii]|uniref:Asp23/Gls24 family envelope stress response protein n=1 Tax=Tomitella gaofuii TaxID=2760083 RepID=UPI0015FE463B|nr:Asp23/Gls24 family envelope stress response protein [Tomitella gaofuii]